MADILVALLLSTFAVAYFGTLGGLFAFIVLEAALLGVDYLMPDDDDRAGTAIR